MNPVRSLDQGQSLDAQNPHQRFERLTQSARIHGQSVWLELLRDREEWNSTPDWAQNEAIKAVETRLASDYSHLGAQVYECGGQAHRIGRFEQKSTGALFHLIPGGQFTMGSTQWSDSQPLREVLVKAFLMGASPVTQAQWDKVGGPDDRSWRGASRPIEMVAWDDVQAWLKKAGEGLSLPSEAEWEYACRAGTTTAFCFGDSDTGLGDYAWFDKNSGNKTKPVTSKKPNAFGLYDVHGNIWEWCQDTWHTNYNGAPTDGSAWTTGGNDSKRVRRGGCWDYDAGYCRSAFRNRLSSSYRYRNLGFRLCLRLD